MKIQIREEGREMNLSLPDWLIFSRFTARLAISAGRKYAPEAMENIPPEALSRLFAELRRIKEKHGTWELVEVNSADGEQVKIIL